MGLVLFISLLELKTSYFTGSLEGMFGCGSKPTRRPTRARGPAPYLTASLLGRRVGRTW